MGEKEFKYGNLNIFYRAEGKGLPVVLLHGIPFNGNIWDRQIDFLKDHCKLIVPDIPGSGRSVFEKPGALASAIEYYADCIYALVKYEQENSCLMFGHSMGGYITLACKEKYPDLLKGFGLIHSTAFADSDERKQIRQNSIALIKEKGAYEFLKTFIPPLFGNKFKSEHPGKINRLIEEARQFLPETFINYFKALMQRPDRTVVLKDSRVPVLFVIGTEDVAAPMKDVLQQVHLPGISYMHILENTGHISMWEATDELNKALIQFIQVFI